MPATLLGKLNRSIRRKDKDAIERTIAECIAAGFPELDSEIQRAREVLKQLEQETEGWHCPF